MKYLEAPPLGPRGIFTITIANAGPLNERSRLGNYQ